MAITQGFEVLFHLAMDGVPHNIDEWVVRGYLAARPEVTQIHDLHIWNMSTVEAALPAHFVMPDGHPGDGFLVKMSQALREHFGMQYATLQIEVGDTE